MHFELSSSTLISLLGLISGFSSFTSSCAESRRSMSPFTSSLSIVAGEPQFLSRNSIALLLVTRSGLTFTPRCPSRPPLHSGAQQACSGNAAASPEAHPAQASAPQHDVDTAFSRREPHIGHSKWGGGGLSLFDFDISKRFSYAIN